MLQIKTHSWEKTPMVLLGNKCDLADDRVVQSEDGGKLASELGTYRLEEKCFASTHPSPFDRISSNCMSSFFILGLEFFETSAKENVNVKIVFERYENSTIVGGNECVWLFSLLSRLVDIILEKMSDASEDPNSSGQANNAYGSQAGAYNKGTTRLTASDQQSKGNPCQC